MEPNKVELPPAAVSTGVRRHSTLLLAGTAVGVIVLFALVLVSPAGCLNADLRPVPRPLPEPVGHVALSDLALTPERFYGQTVTIDGVVDSVIGRHSFVLRADRPLEVGAVLVVSRPALVPPLGSPGRVLVEPGDLVRVTGDVRRFDREAAQRDLRLDLAGDVDAFLTPWNNKPAVIVESPERLVPLDIAPVAPVTPLDALLEQPATYYGQAVTVRGVFDREVAPYAFLLEDGDTLFDDELLVVTTLAFESIPGWPPPSGAAIDPPRLPVTARGILQPFDVAEAERVLGLDLDESRLTAFAGRPVLLSTRLVVTPGPTVVQDR